MQQKRDRARPHEQERREEEMKAAVPPPRCLWASRMKLWLGRTRAGSNVGADRSVNGLLELFLWSAHAWASMICCGGRTWVAFVDVTGCRARWAGSGGKRTSDVAAREVCSLKIDAARRMSQTCARMRCGVIAVVVREGGGRWRRERCRRIAWGSTQVLGYGSVEE